MVGDITRNIAGYPGSRILVTGGTGFIGGRLAERLVIEQAARVRVLVRDWRKAVWVSRLNVELVHGDVQDERALADAMQGCDIVFHCAAVGGTADQCMAINADGSRKVFECAVRVGVTRVVYLSTCAVHGPTPAQNADEHEPFRRNGDPYNDSKIVAEEIAWNYSRDRGLPLVVIRPLPVWGPRSPAFTLWPIKNIKTGRWRLIDGGKGTCQTVYIDNLVDSLLLAGISPAAAGEAFLIDDDAICAWRDFFGFYARMTGHRIGSSPLIAAKAALFCNEHLGYLQAALQDLPDGEPLHTLLRVCRKGIEIARRAPAHYSMFSAGELDRYTYRGRFDTSKARRVLKYKPRYSLQHGMRETESWLRDQCLI